MLLEKLLSGKFRKHSEQLNKFVAGFFDADGSIYIYEDRGNIGLRASIGQSASKDPDFEVMRALQKHYNLGRIIYYLPPDGENQASACMWNLSTTDSKKLYNLIGKHLLIKATHFENLIWIQEECKGCPVKGDIREFSDCSRKHSKYLKRPKHISWAYAAGYIAGDGHLRCKTYKRSNSQYPANRLDIYVASGDEIIVQLFQESFKGNTRFSERDNTFMWYRGLGKHNTLFAMKFLPKIRKYMLLKTKRNVIDRMLDFHRLPTETKCVESKDMR